MHDIRARWLVFKPCLLVLSTGTIVLRARSPVLAAQRLQISAFLLVLITRILVLWTCLVVIEEGGLVIGAFWLVRWGQRSCPFALPTYHVLLSGNVATGGSSIAAEWISDAAGTLRIGYAEPSGLAG